MPERERWEYETAILTGGREQDIAILKKWGNAGWELVAVTHMYFGASPSGLSHRHEELAMVREDSIITAYFKRRQCAG